MIQAVVCELNLSENISIVKFKAQDNILSMLSLENFGLKIGQKVRLGFKSSDVFLSTKRLEYCSVNNELKATITRIELGDIVACVHLKSQNIIFESIISSMSCQRLGLKTDDNVFAYIKSTSLFISSFE